MKDSNTEHLLWEDSQEKKVYQGPIFDIKEVQRISADNKLARFVIVEAPKWVTMIPWYIADNGVAHFKMVRQFRHGSGKVTIEFPAGTVDPDENVLLAGLRELKEETGCVPAQEPVLIGSVSPNPAFMNNRVWFYAIEGLECVGEQSLDEHEHVDILDIPVQEVLDSMGTGEYDNGIMMIAQAFFIRYAAQKGGIL